MKVNCKGYPTKFCFGKPLPHCASDGKTYPNRCRFCNAFVKSHGLITLRYYGKCK
uniref:Kazal-type inhibitor-like protein n=1 Tax=Bothriechis schlegelii TaxID=44725 RepID=KTIL_BOTSC|nr:RecName: Full=Kazal-type inhibitor-like protein; Short=KTIL [Bothriechis schlegelii]